MKTQGIGKSDIKTSQLSLGTWAIGGGTWWGENDDEISIKTIRTALDKNITWIDTARVYGFGHSEEIVGRAIKGRRQEAIISTKCALQWYDNSGEFHFEKEGHKVYRNPSPAAIRRDLELSLKALQTDYIDIYFTHWQCKEYGTVPIEETMGELMKMKKEGKIRAIGASNVTRQHLEEYTTFGQLDVIQEKYSMLDRKAEIELLPFCEANSITLQAYSPIEQGLLAGKIPSDYQVKPGEARENKLWWRPENLALANEMLKGWDGLKQKYNCTTGNLVLAWTMMRSEAINVLCGARKIEQLEENSQALNITLDQTDFEKMNYDAERIIQKANKN